MAMSRYLLCSLFLFSSLCLAGLNEDIKITIEEPVRGGVYSGISNLRGWAISPEGMGSYYLEVYVDGEFAFYMHPYGQRPDVGNAYPNYPGSETGGFSMAFNYKNLSPGEHEIRVRAWDNASDYNEAVSTFTTERFVGSFISDSSDINLSTAETIYADDDQTVLINGATIEGKRWDFKLKWDKASQGFKTEAIQPFDQDPSGSSSGGDGSTDNPEGESGAPFAPNSQASYMVRYSSDDPYTLSQPGCGYTPPGGTQTSNCNCADICKNFEMTVSFSSTGRRENGRDIISAQYPFYDGTRSLDFYYDQNGTLRQLSSWDGRFDQFDYRAQVWGAPLIVAQNSIASGDYDVGIGRRTQTYAKKNLEGRLTNTGVFTTEVPAFSGPVLVSVIELRGEMTWEEADTEYPEGSKADVYHRIAWSDDYGIVWLEKTMEIYESTITGGFLNPVEIYESWEMIEKP